MQILTGELKTKVRVYSEATSFAEPSSQNKIKIVLFTFLSSEKTTQSLSERVKYFWIEADKTVMASAKKKHHEYSPIESRFSVYFKALDALRADKVLKFKRNMNKPSLSYEEKRLLLARLEMHGQNWKEAITILKTFKSGSHPFVLGEVNNLLYYCMASSGDMKHSFPFLEKAYSYFREIDYGRGSFNSMINAGIHWDNLGDLDKAEHYFKIAEKHAFKDFERADLFRSYAILYSYQNRKEETIKYIHQSLELAENLPSRPLVPVLMNAYRSFFNIGMYEVCEQFIEKAAKYRSNQLYDEVLTDKLLFHFYMKGEWAKKIPQVVEESSFGRRYLICQSLDKGYIERAKGLWAQLRELAPDSFGDDFQLTSISEEKSVFGACLVRLREVKTISAKSFKEKFNAFKDKLPNSKSETLIFVLKLIAEPCEKEDLIEAVWDVPYDPSFDQRFYKLMERVKKSGAVNIEMIGGGYLYKES